MPQLRRFEGSPETVDRVLLGGCVVIWLAVVGTAVAATVALVDKGTGHGAHDASGGTPWLLYAVIAVSAVIILGAIPLLLRARRAAAPQPRRTPAVAGARSVGGQRVPVPDRPAAEAATEKLRVFGTRADPLAREPMRRPSPEPAPLALSAAEVDRMWLRTTTAIIAAMGVATLAVAVAAYFMGVDADGSTWSALVVAGIVVVAMPAVPWWSLRQLRARVAEGQ